MTGANDDNRYREDDPSTWDDQPGQPLETDRLDLDDGEERLPWLETAEDEDYVTSEGYDSGRLAKWAALAAIGLVAIVGTIWWLNNSAPDQALVADGSLVAAPSEPYKTAPANPGGKTFDGTGDSSFAVSEGQNRPAQLGGSAAAGTPGASPKAAPSAAASGTAAPKAAAAAAGGVGVQVGAFSSQASAEAAWAKLSAQADGALSGVAHRVITGSADNGTIYRLQAVASDTAAAGALCGRLKAVGIACQVK
jgi:hypothetical protein